MTPPHWALRGFASTTTPKPASGHLHVTVEPQSGPLEGVSVLTLCRPEARNAIGRQMLRELEEAIGMLRGERSTKCVVLRSSVPGEWGRGGSGGYVWCCAAQCLVTGGGWGEGETRGTMQFDARIPQSCRLIGTIFDSGTLITGYIPWS